MDEPDPRDDGSHNNDFLNLLATQMEVAQALRAKAEAKKYCQEQAESVGMLFNEMKRATNDVELSRKIVEMFVSANLARGMFPNM